MVRAELKAYNQTLDITDCISNLDEIEVTLERDGIDAVYKKTTFDFEFVADAYDILSDIFDAHRQFSKADVLVYRRNTDFSYSDSFEKYELDFLTFSKTEDIITVSSRDKSLQSIIKSKQGVTYDLNVDSLKEDKTWKHYGIKLFNTAVSGINSIAEMPDKFNDCENPYQYSPHYLFHDTSVITLGGSYREGNAIIKDKVEVGQDRPSFLSAFGKISSEPDALDGFNEMYIWKCTKSVSGIFKVNVRGMITAALGYSWEGYNDGEHGSLVSGHPAYDWGDVDLHLTVFISAVKVRGDTVTPIFDWLKTVQDMKFREPGSTNRIFSVNRITEDNKLWTDIIPATFALKIGSNNMPDCFPVDESTPPLTDDDYLEISIPNTVINLDAGDEIRINMGVKVVDWNGVLGGGQGFIPSSERIPNEWQYNGYFTPKLFPYIRKYLNSNGLSSPRGSGYINNPDLAPIQPPTGIAGDQKYFFGATDWRFDRPSWLDGKITFEYIAQMPSSYFSVINPLNLLQRLVDEMTLFPGLYETGIEGMNDNNQDLDMLMAGESLVPSFENPKLHTSFNDFKSWVETLGYSLSVTENGVYFIRRDSAFNKNIIALDLTDTECEDLTESIDEKMIYTSSKVGYSKQTYEGDNARLEFNGEHDYSIDDSLTTNELSLISKYRADSLGLELKWIKLLEDTTRNNASTDSDKDVFAINLRDDGINYVQIETVFIEGENMGQYNWKYNPLRLLLNNMDLLSASGRTVRFTASSANSNYSVEENNTSVKLSDDIDLNLANISIDPIIYDFSTGSHKDLPSMNKWVGVIRFAYNGKIKEGFISEINKFINEEQEVQYKLYQKHDGWKEEMT